MNQRLKLSKLWEGSRKTCQGLELGSGNPTVQDLRGASGTVGQGEKVNPSCSRKSRRGNPSPTARRARFLSQPLWFKADAGPRKRGRRADRPNHRACTVWARPVGGRPASSGGNPRG